MNETAVALHPGPALLRQMQVELKLSLRRWGEVLNPLVFFAAVIALFPLALSPDRNQLAGLAPAAVWVAALLSALFAQARLFRQEAQNGTLEMMALSPLPLWLQLAAKLFAQWLLLAVPLLILAPIAAYSLYLPEGVAVTLVLALVLATPTMIVLGAFGAALSVHAQQGGTLLSVLVLPMLVPVLIFGARATALSASGNDPAGGLYWLAALCALSLGLGPFAVALAVRTTLD